MIIAQLTDSHIRADDGLAYGRVDTKAFLARAVEHLNNLVPPPDVTLVTGDICDFGRPREYQIARQLLDRLAMPYFVIPGNHDHVDNLRASFEGHDYLPDVGFLHYVIEDYVVRLIGLDTTIPGEPGGEICEARRRWLSDQLNRNIVRPTLLFMHHPPFLTGIRHMDVQNCAGGAALGQMLAAYPQVKTILCGHVHRSISVLWHGIEASIAPSPAHAVTLDLDPEGPPAYHLEPPACRVVHLNDKGLLVNHLSYIGDFDGPYPFTDTDGKFLE